MCRLSLLAVGLAFVAVACSKSKSTPAVSIPEKPILRPAPSQPLTLDEYSQFKNFVQAQEGAQFFLPQNYLFTQTDESHLPTNQQQTLAQIRQNCQISDVPTSSDNNDVHSGSVISSRDSRKVSSGACPIKYAFDQSVALTVADATEEIQSASGPLSVSETMSVFNSDISSVTGSVYSSVDANGSLAFVNQKDKETRVRITLSSSSQVSSVNPANSHTESVEADVIIATNPQTQQSSIALALNITVVVPSMNKTVVLSLSGGVDSAGGQATGQFTVNGSMVSQADQIELLQSKFFSTILQRVLASGSNGSNQAIQMMKDVAFE